MAEIVFSQAGSRYPVVAYRDGAEDGRTATGATEDEARAALLAAEREDYLSLADELDPIGASSPVVWNETDWDESVVGSARAYATEHALAFPPLAGIDVALDEVSETERRALWGDR